MEATQDLNILVIRPDAIGDLVLTIPLLNSIKLAYPEAKITVYVQPLTEPLLQNHPAVESLSTTLSIPYLKQQAFDMAFFPYSDHETAALVKKAGVPVRVGDQDKLGLRRFFTHSIPMQVANLSRHTVEQNLALLHAINPRAALSRTMDLYPNPQEKSQVKNTLKGLGWDGKPFILIHPSTGGHNRTWPPEKFAAFIQKFIADYQVVLTGNGDSEQALVDEIIGATKSKSSQLLNMANRCSLSELKALLSLAAIVIGADTGPTHMAAAFQRPVLQLSPTKFVKAMHWGPWNTVNRVVNQSHACPLVCKPSTCAETHCLDAISVEQLYQAFQDLQQQVEQQSSAETHSEQAGYNETWFSSSGRIALLIDDRTSLDALFPYLDQANTEGLPISLLTFSTKALTQYQSKKAAHHPALHKLSRHRFLKLIHFISTENLLLIHSQNPQPYLKLICKIAALFLIAPPQLTTGPIPNTKTMVKHYLETLKALWNNPQ